MESRSQLQSPPWQARLIKLAVVLALMVTFFLTKMWSYHSLPGPAQTSLQKSYRQSDVHHALKKASIIPDILPDFTPVCTISASYSSKKSGQVLLGNKLKPSKTKKQPAVWITCADIEGDLAELRRDVGENYTIALTDPDAPSRKDPKWSEMCHWIATETGDVVEYKAPGPPKHTSYHRYIFVLLKGDNRNLTAPADRQHWGSGKERHGIADWAKNQSLEIVGANFFYAKHE